jgi:hypothetical protein
MYFYCYVCVFLLYVYVSLSCQLALYGYHDWGFSVSLPQLWGKCQDKTHKGGARPALFQNFYVVLYIVCFVSLCVLFVCKCVLYYCQRIATQLQLTNTSHHIISNHIILYHIISYEYHIYSFISIQPLGRFSRNQNPVRRPVWLWHTASWASS